MSDQLENVVLVLLRRIETKLDRVAEDVHDLKVRMTSLESNMAGMNRRLDRFEDRLDRIERRMDIVPAEG